MSKELTIEMFTEILFIKSKQQKHLVIENILAVKLQYNHTLKRNTVT